MDDFGNGQFRKRDEFEMLAKQYAETIKKVKRIVPVFIILLVAVVVGFTSMYSVEADSEAVILRFGKYNRTETPGLHFKLPWPIENVYEVPVQRIQSLEFGFSTENPGVVTSYAPTNNEQKQVANMLTGDLNLAHIEWIVQYRIKDAYDYLFKVGGDYTENAIRDVLNDVSESVMRQLVGDSSVDEVITIGRDQIASDAEINIQKMIDKYETGVEIVTVKLQSATPPDAVKDAFDEVNRAKQNKERIINEAKGERNKKIPAARGQRDRMITEAEGYRERVVQKARGEVSAFTSQLAEYEKAPEITRIRLYIETMEDIFANNKDKLIIDESIQGLLPFLDVNAKETPGSATTPRAATPTRNNSRR